MYFAYVTERQLITSARVRHSLLDLFNINISFECYVLPDAFNLILTLKFELTL